MRRALCLGLASGASVLGLAREAEAYCRTTTCDPSAEGANEFCEWDNGCLVGGEPLHWPQRCVSFSVQRDGSEKRHISADEAQAIIGQAFAQWTHVPCQGKAGPSIEVHDRGPVICDRQEYNQDQGNANIWMFRDHDWPYEDDGTLALTTITFNVDTGEIYDADVEINSADNSITAGDVSIRFDLASIVMHEAGHVLGLSHSTVPTATMYTSYSPGSHDLRNLDVDDVRGVCAAIAPDRAVSPVCDPTPRHGFASRCGEETKGCVATGVTTGGRQGPVGLGAVLAGLLLLRVRSRRHLQSPRQSA